MLEGVASVTGPEASKFLGEQVRLADGRTGRLESVVFGVATILVDGREVKTGVGRLRVESAS